MMTTKLEISKTIGAHRKWKERLQKAIETGTSEFKPATVKVDHACELGKWLTSEAAAQFQQSEYWQPIKQTHAEFHREAAHILEMALLGHKQQAQTLLNGQNKFAQTSQTLISLLLKLYFAGSETQAHSQVDDQTRASAVLAERAKALTVSTETETGEMVQLVVFQLANEKYGIDTSCVREVQPLRELTPVPCAPGFVLGVINIRGSLYSVIDIRSFLGVEKNPVTDLTRVILVDVAGLEIGILVDEAKGAANVLVNEIKPPLAMLGAAKEEFIRGVTKDMLTVLNFEALVRDERIIVHEEV